MTFLNFDNQQIEKTFYRIARAGGDKNKIDTPQEKAQLACVFQGAGKQIGVHDLKLLSLGTLDFEDKKVEKEYLRIANGKTRDNKISDIEEFEELKRYISSTELRENDKKILTYLKGLFEEKNIILTEPGSYDLRVLKSAGLNVINNAEGASANIYKGVKPAQNNVTEQAAEEIEEEPEIEAKSEPAPEPKTVSKPRTYKVNKGDYWYKMVAENYNTASPSEINKIVRKFKDEYFNTHRDMLIKQGYTSSKKGFFLKAGEIFNLPQSIEIDGKFISLK